MPEAKKTNNPNHLLRRERERRGWSQRRVAEQLGTTEDKVSRWERGEVTPSPFYREKLCILFEKDAGELGFIDEQSSLKESFDGQKLSLEDVESDDMDKYRRQALQILGITGTSLLIGSPSMLKEVETLFTRRMARLQTWVLDSLEDGTRLRWQLYYTSNNSLTEEGLLSQITKLEQLPRFRPKS